VVPDAASTDNVYRGTSPPVALLERREARVVLRSSIDAHGAVTEARVADSGGVDLAVAARRAALGFSPALDNGDSVASRIHYADDFSPPESVGSAPRVLASAAAPRVPQAASAAVPSVSPASSAGRAPASALELTVQGESRAERLRASAQEVKVIDVRRARRQSADLGEARVSRLISNEPCMG
jgi:hypothetical protein